MGSNDTPNSSALQSRLDFISSTPLSRGFCCRVACGLTGGKAIRHPVASQDWALSTTDPFLHLDKDHGWLSHLSGHGSMLLVTPQHTLLYSTLPTYPFTSDCFVSSSLANFYSSFRISSRLEGRMPLTTAGNRLFPSLRAKLHPPNPLMVQPSLSLGREKGDKGHWQVRPSWLATRH